jgi:hypothetical protein
MKNEYTAPEVIEVDKAQEVILGVKPGSVFEDLTAIEPDSELDE